MTPAFQFIVCDTGDNGHWRLIESRPDLVTSHPDFSEFLKNNDTENDFKARETMKYHVFASGLVRIGLIFSKGVYSGYVDAMSARSARKAVAFMLDESGGSLQSVDLNILPSDLKAFLDSDPEDFFKLDHDGVQRFVKFGKYR